ncbi:CFA/I fimbrial subunit C precursor [Vibrio sp. JCM 19236]|nr:CFA/I fimbrial subunit C precursor [Vibrio sp. JCM 19236]
MKKLLKEKLLYSGIKKEVVELVFNKIVGKECSFSKCESIDVDFNYDAKSLSVIVSSELLAEDFEQQPYTNISPSLNGVISTNSLNSSYYTDSLNYTYSNETLFGLGHGFVDTGVNISGSESGTKSDVDKVIYYHNFSGHRLNFGYSEFSGENNDNASGILDFTTANDRYFVSFGTSNNLLKKKKEQFKRVYFDMKSKGLVRFLRDGKVIKSNYYNQGQNFVTFSELPQGNYQLEIRIKAEGFPEEVQYRQINNNLNQFSIDNSDFNVSIMAFELDDEYFADDYASVGELAYAARHDNGLIWGASARFSPLGSELGLYTGLEINNVSTSAYIASGRGGSILIIIWVSDVCQ